MQEGIFISESAEERRIQDWLLNPFRYVAGAVALFLGLVAILGSALIGYAVPVHFDGVLDVHFVGPAPLWFFIAEGLSAWLCMALMLQVFAAILAPARFRFVDVLGTQALARWPYLFIALVSIPTGLQVTLTYLAEEATKVPHTVTPTAGDMVVTVVAFGVILVATIWSVMLMYKGYSVSTGIKEMSRRIVSFIVALIIAEVASKVIFIVMGVQAGVLPASQQSGA